MRVLIIGASGQLGTDLCKVLNDRAIPLTHKDVEICDIYSVKQAFNKYSPDIAINTAAYVNVDGCETERDRAFIVNALGARNVAVVAQNTGVKLVHISTDYVFGGDEQHWTIPYCEFDTPVPVNTYGKSKLAGEEFVRNFCLRYFIVRSSGLFGVAGASGKGGNFVDTIVKLAQEKDELCVVDDQVVSPTYTKDLAEKIAELIETDCYGTFHITNKGYCSWYEFACEILRLVGLKTQIIPIRSDEYRSPARRPRFSALDNFHLRLIGMDSMRDWREAVADYIREKEYVKKDLPKED